MMKLKASIKREITEDWATQFPDLGIYKPLWLLRRVGPLLEGICLNRDSSNERYQPIFHLHSLARDESSLSLTLADELRTARNDTPQKIKVAFHADHYVEAAKKMKQQASLALSGPVFLTDVLHAYESYMTRPLGKYPVPLFEDIITMLVWCGLTTEAARKLAQFESEMKSWPSSIASLQRVGGVNAWSEKCQSWITNPTTVRNTVEAQIAFHGVEHLPTVELST